MLLEHGVDRDVDTTQLDDSKEGDDELGTVGKEDSHPIALLQTLFRQETGHPVTEIVELTESQLGAVIDEAGSVRCLLSPLSQVFTEKNLAKRVNRLLRKARGPVLLPKLV
jgi:hypothetical protein